MKSIRIAIVINTSWNVFNFRLGLLNALRDNGAQIIVIAPEDNYSEKLVALGFEYYDLKMNNKGINPIEEVRLIYHLYKLYKDISPDILLHYTIKPNIYGAIAAKTLGIPVISNISGLGTVFLNNSLSSKIARMLYKVILHYPKIIFFQNSDDLSLFTKLKLVKKEKASLLPGSGINTEIFKPNEYLEQGATNNELQFLFIGRLVKDKGIEEFVCASRVFQSISLVSNRNINVRFAILGSFYPDNPTAICEDDMKKWINEGIIEYLGTSDDVKPVIEAADCIVLPSYREGLSRVLLEASSLQKPIITTNVPGCRDVVSDGITGYLCEVKNHNSLVDQMMKIALKTKKERIKMGRLGREKVIREFSESKVINKYINGISEIIENLKKS